VMADVSLWNAATTLPRILAISRVVELGYPSPRLVGLAMRGAVWARVLRRESGLLALVVGAENQDDAAQQPTPRVSSAS
jgi:hypothetical protein